MVASISNISKTSILALKSADSILVVDPYSQAHLLANVSTTNSTLPVPDGIKPPSIPYCGCKMNSVRTITEETVLTNMKIMNVNKAPGPDGIPGRVIIRFYIKNLKN